MEPDAAEQGNAPLAMIGARPCELAGLDVLDRVLEGGATADPATPPVGTTHS